MKRTGLFITSFFGLGIMFTKPALAVCPICTLAVGAGVGFSRWLGIDDSIAGLWIGGLTVSLIEWTLQWFSKKEIYFRYRGIITAVSYYALIVIPLYFAGVMGHPQNALPPFGMDRLLLGIITGSLGFYVGAKWYFYLKEKNAGRAHFPFQKVVMPIAPLIIASIIFYIVGK